MKSSQQIIKIFSAVLCILFLLAGFVLQMLPYWQVSQPVSISGYVWFPRDHEDLTIHFQQTVQADFDVQSLVLYSLLQVLVPIGAVILAASRQESLWLALGAGLTGISGIWSLATKAVLRSGTFWVALLALSVLSVLSAAFWFWVNRNRKVPSQL